MFYWFLKTVVLGPVLRVLFRPWVEGAENIPEDGPAIFASNHLSFSDSIFLPLVVPRRMTFLAKSDYFTGRGVKGRLTAAFFKGVGQLPIDRSGKGAGDAALRAGLRVLGHGDILGIYPEGTRSPDGRLYRGRTGVARMALASGAPVIPVAMIGTDKAQPTGQIIPNISRVGMRIGRPLDFSRYAGMENDRFVLRSVTDEIMYELMLLSEQEYVDIYASSMKERLLKAAKAQAEQLAERTQQLQDATQQLQETTQQKTQQLSELTQARAQQLRDAVRQGSGERPDADPKEGTDPGTDLVDPAADASADHVGVQDGQGRADAAERPAG